MQPLRPHITIFEADGTPLIQVLAESGSKLTANLMRDDYVTLNFTTTEAVRFTRGCYCIIPTCADRTMPVKYMVMDEVHPTYDEATGGYKYQMRMDAWYQSWARYKFSLAPAYGAVQTDFSYTQTISEHVRLIAEQLSILADRDSSITAPTAYCIHYLDRTDLYALAEVANARAEVDGAVYDATVLVDGESEASAAKVIVDGGTNPYWQLVHSEAIPAGEQADPDTNDATYLLDDRIRLVTYSDNSIIEAINTMCGEDAFNCEWWMERDILHFGRCEQGTALSLTRGTQLANVERAKASQEYGTRLIAFGSDRNIPSRYRKYVALTATNVTNTRGSEVGSNNDAFDDDREVSATSAGQRMSVTFPYHSAVSVQVQNGLSATINVEVDVTDDTGDTEHIQVELWHGDKDNGGTLIATFSEDDTYLSDEDSVFAEVGDAAKDIYMYVTVTGLSGAASGGAYSYHPYVEANFEIDYFNAEKQVLFDTNHKVTSKNFFPTYRCSQIFRIGNVVESPAGTVSPKVTIVDGVPKVSFIGRDLDPQYTRLGYADYYSTIEAGLVYSWKYRATIRIELDGQPTNPQIRNRIDQVAIFSGPLGNMYFRATDEGEYTVEGVLDVARHEQAISSALDTSIVALVPAGVSATITILDLQWSSTSDGFDPTTSKEVQAEHAIAVTPINHADAYGNPIGTSYEAYVDEDGNIEIDEHVPFAVGDRFTMEGLRNESIDLSWFTDKYGESSFCSYARRLMLPEDTCPKNYIDSPRIQTEGVTRQPEVVEVVKVFDDIYPEQTLTPYAVECYAGEHKIIDDDGSEQTMYVRRYAMYIKKVDFPFNEQYIPSGMSLQCIFQTGLLSGCGFELGYAGTVLLPEIMPQDEEDTRFCKFYIIPNTDYGVELPNETLHPIGKYYADRFTNQQAPFVLQTTDADQLIMVNYLSSALTEFGYVEAAERRLETAARAYLDKISLDSAEYTATLANDYAEQLYTEGTGYPTIGQKVALSDATYFDEPRDTRVIGIERALDIPYDSLVLHLGESLRYSRTRDILNQLKQR